MPTINVVRNIPSHPTIAKISMLSIISMKAHNDVIINSAPIIPLYFFRIMSDIPKINVPIISNIPAISNIVEEAIIVAPTSFPNCTGHDLGNSAGGSERGPLGCLGS